MQPTFIDQRLAEQIHETYGSPVYVYHEDLLIQQAQKVCSFPHAYGLTVRYAMKANANSNILRLFNQHGIYIDASSIHELHRALAAGISGDHIQLS